MAFIEFNSCPLHFELNGEGPNILFLHGLGADCRQTNYFLKNISGYRVITVDLPGHGRSLLLKNKPIVEQVGFRLYRRAVQHVLSHLAITSVIVGGISMGAGIALQLALLNAVQVRAMLIVRPAWLDRPGRPHLDIIEKIGGWIEKGGQKYAEKQLKNYPLYIDTLVNNPSCAASIYGAITRPQAVEAAGVLAAMVADHPIDNIKMLRECNIPTLVISNDSDPLHPMEIALQIADELPENTYFKSPSKYREPKAYQVATTLQIQTFLAQVQ